MADIIQLNQEEIKSQSGGFGRNSKVFGSFSFVSILVEEEPKK